MYTAWIKKVETEEVKECGGEFPGDVKDEVVDFMWSDGNYGCDCNRGIFFGDGDVECGDSKYILVKLVGDDGTIVGGREE